MCVYGAFCFIGSQDIVTEDYFQPVLLQQEPEALFPKG